MWVLTQWSCKWQLVWNEETVSLQFLGDSCPLHKNHLHSWHPCWLSHEKPHTMNGLWKLNCPVIRAGLQWGKLMFLMGCSYAVDVQWVSQEEHRALPIRHAQVQQNEYCLYSTVRADPQQQWLHAWELSNTAKNTFCEHLFESATFLLRKLSFHPLC